MKYYAHFTTQGEENLGSDAWYQLDGRTTLATKIVDAIHRMRQLRFVQPNYDGFQIRRGDSPSRSVIIYTRE